MKSIMKKDNPISTIAAFAVLKALNDSKAYKSPYQLLGCFIDYIIESEQLHTFEAAEIRLKLQNSFGFNVPEAVIKSSLKSLEFVKRNNNEYAVTRAEHNTRKQFVAMKADAESTYGAIVDSIIESVKKTHPNADKDKIAKAVITHLVDEYHDSDYSEEISTFIVSNEANNKLQEFINAVREGGILYLGINHNISEYGSLKHDLTLYLDTEILFDLLGYNGSIYETLARDFYLLVQKGKRKGQIYLKYFRYVKLEIERFFKGAERLVEGRGYYYEEKPAMKYIVNGCRTSADVRVKMADFFEKLRSMAVLEEETNACYSEDFGKFDLEHPDCKNEREIEGWKAICHINKLRRGQIYDFELDSHFMLVTDSRNVLETSNVQVEKDKASHADHQAAQYAVSLNYITNLLWYKLDGGFGGDKFPSNALLLLRSRIVLSECIAKRVEAFYQENKERYTKGEINQEQLAARVLVLREKPSLPEEISKDNIQDALDFSPTTLSRIEVEIQSNRQLRFEQEKIIQSLQAENQEILAVKTKEIEEKEAIILRKNNELKAFQQKEAERDKRKQTVKKFAYLFLRIIGALFVIGLVYYANVKCENLNKWIKIALDSAGILSLLVVTKKPLLLLWGSIKSFWKKRGR